MSGDRSPVSVNLRYVCEQNNGLLVRLVCDPANRSQRVLPDTADVVRASFVCFENQQLLCLYTHARLKTVKIDGLRNCFFKTYENYTDVI